MNCDIRHVRWCKGVTTKHCSGLAAIVATIFLSIASGALAPSAAAHVDPPTVTALHAFIGDPLFGLDTAEGSLFGIAPDERTAMASTTKLMTLDVTLNAVDDGVVSLDDQVTVDPFAASLEPPNSVMADINGVTLEPGEVVRLETLIRGMMYPSGNDAAWAIAYYVAQAYAADLNGDGVVDGNDFVVRMNQHAADIGLLDTHFTSPNGWDDPTNPNPSPADLNHYTTARELGEIIDHGLNAHRHFGEVIGFQGTYTDTSQGPNGPKTYSWSWGSSYPGWEGAKGGSTQNCNGLPGRFCLATSAKRLGRRVVATFMQGVGGGEVAGMLDYGFAQIFHPDPRGESAPLSPAETQEALDCLSSDRAVTAFLESGGPAKLAVWQPDLNASTITKLAEASLPDSSLPKGKGSGQGPPRRVAVAHLSGGDVIMAFRTGAQVELSRWSLAPNGTPTLLGDGIKAGPAATMALQPVYGNMFLTVIVNPDGALVVKSWALENGGPGLTRMDKYQDDSRVYQEAAVAGPDHVDVLNGHRAMTAAQDTGGNTVHQVWSVDPQTGQIMALGSLVEPGDRSGFSIAPVAVEPLDGELFQPVYYATGYKASTGVYMRFYRIDAGGTPVLEAFPPTGVAVAQNVRLASLGKSGVLTAVRSSSGDVGLSVWEARRKADNGIAAYKIVDHPAYGGASSLDLCRVASIHAEGDYLAASIGAGNSSIGLRAFRSGDRP
jgi:D-alanyl-D-alanine carboxypeptidase